MRYQGRSKRKYTGKRIRELRGSKKFHLGSDNLETHAGDERSKPIRGRGGNWRDRLLRAQYANVTNPATGKTKKVGIKTVESNPANIHFVRRNVISKGSVIRTSIGTATVTSRPGQHGVVNAVLLKADKKEKLPEKDGSESLDVETDAVETAAKPKRTRKTTKKDKITD